MAATIDATTQRWTDAADMALTGRIITAVRYMNAEERDALDWHRSTLIIELDDGNSLWASADDEGNDAGALFTTVKKLPVIPVI